MKINVGASGQLVAMKISSRSYMSLITETSQISFRKFSRLFRHKTIVFIGRKETVIPSRTRFGIKISRSTLHGDKDQREKSCVEAIQVKSDQFSCK